MLTGCASMSPAERAWQTMHLVDVAQTVNAAGDPCYREIAWDTRAIIGEHPEPEAAIAWGVAAGVVHYFAFRWIDSRDWPDGVKVALRSVDLSYKGYTVARNHSEGIRPFGENVACSPEPIFRPDAEPVK